MFHLYHLKSDLCIQSEYIYPYTPIAYNTFSLPTVIRIPQACGTLINKVLCTFLRLTGFAYYLISA